MAGIILGTGGDNSNWNRGTFFEGVMVSGHPSDAAENAVQADIVSVGYAGGTDVPNGSQGTVTGPGASAWTPPPTTPAPTAPPRSCGTATWAEDQHWQHNADGSLSIIGRCLDIEGNGTANGTEVELWDCNGVGGQKWVQQVDGSLRSPQSGRCLDSPSGATANGTRPQIWDCNSSAAQRFALT
ncbi:arabinofuranosidase catalytic domain-containing protein [Streptomyces griseofuscus]|uniref:arabinofuranosidase catalytic domain-containing protein n=1 Tax=Streptomyces griseofuscus TaxID=146922 RepID=UPI0036C3B7D7